MDSKDKNFFIALAWALKNSDAKDIHEFEEAVKTSYNDLVPHDRADIQKAIIPH